jgi:PST family polysaccharide transporter
MKEIHGKAKRGIKLMMGRQLILQVVGLFTGIILARRLSPAEFGIFAIATFLVQLFAFMSDFGLAGSFIQRESEPTDRERSVAFTLQQVLTLVIVVLLWIAAPWLAAFYPKAPPETYWLIRALAFGLYLTSWRTMSALQLERHLRYTELAIIEVIENLVYQGLAVALALTGYGVWSFVWATLARSIVGAVGTYIASPWPIRFAYDSPIAKAILRYGVPFQFQAVLNQISAWVTPVVVGPLIGPAAVGYLGWASAQGRRPLILVDNVMRVAYPHFARIQSDREEVIRILLRYVMYLLLPMGLWFTLIVIAAPSAVTWIYTDKWNPAVIALMLYAFAMLGDLFSWTVGVTLNAVGEVRFMTKVVVVRGVLNFAFALPLMHFIGFNAVPIGYIGASLFTAPWLLHRLGRGTFRRTIRAIAWTLIPVPVAMLLGKLSLYVPVNIVLKTFVSASVVCAAYVTTVWLIAPTEMRQIMAQWLRSFMKSKPPVTLASNPMSEPAQI